MKQIIFILKKMLTFLFLYLLSAMIAGVAVTAVLLLADMVWGEVMTEDLAADFAMLVQYYGFFFFLLSAVWYWTHIEKESLEAMGFRRTGFVSEKTGRPCFTGAKCIWSEYIKGIFLALLLLAEIIGVGMIFGHFSFEGFGRENNPVFLCALFVGIMIQSAAEEALCRGFLLHSLLKKVSAPIAAALSTAAFILPHLASLLEAEPEFAVIGVTNLCLISALFSLLVLKRENLWIACGLHGGWNFLLQAVCGMTLSGSEAQTTGILIFDVKNANIWSGGSYGMEAGLLTAIVLGAAIMVPALRKRGKHGIQKQII